MRNLLALTLVVLMTSAHADAPDFAGEWVNYDNGGVYNVQDLTGATCVIQVITERRYIFWHLQGVPTIRHGLYAAITHERWLARTSEHCTLPGQPSQNAYITTRQWDLDFNPPPDASRFEIGAKFHNCMGHLCDAPTTFKSDFTANLTIGPNAIVDQGDGANLGRTEFIRLSELKKQAISGISPMLEHLIALTPDQESAFVDEFVDPSVIQRLGRDTVLTRLHRYYVQKLQGGGSYDVVEAYMMPAKTSPIVVPSILYATVAHKSLDGSELAEVMELASTEGHWRFVAGPGF